MNIAFLWAHHILLCPHPPSVMYGVVGVWTTDGTFWQSFLSLHCHAGSSMFFGVEQKGSNQDASTPFNALT